MIALTPAKHCRGSLETEDLSCCSEHNISALAVRAERGNGTAIYTNEVEDDLKAVNTKAASQEARGENSVIALAINTPSAMAVAITPHLKSIWRYAFSLCGKADVADDLTQSTVLRAMEKYFQFRPDSSLVAWCLSICRSIWLNDMRSQSIRKTQSMSASAEVQDMAMNTDTEMNIFANQVFTHVMELPEAQRETAILVYVEGFKYSEAAELLDVPMGTIMSRLATVRGKLKHLGQTTMAPTAQGTH